MKNRKNTVLLFSKLPEVGKVKTRLSTLKDGMFAPETACDLYQAMLLDVSEICLDAFNRLEDKKRQSQRFLMKSDDTNKDRLNQPDICDTYELVISTTPHSNIEPMKRLFSENGVDISRIRFISDSGKTFDEHYNDAFEKTWKLGADNILSMGADMPALQTDDIIRGFDALHELDESNTQGIVIAPDQEMGVSIIGWTRKTEFSHTGVFYNKSGLTVLPAYIEKAEESDLAAIVIPAVVDVDTISDLAHNITLIQAALYASKFQNNHFAERTWHTLEDLGLTEIRIPPNDLMDPREDIDIDLDIER